MSRAPSLAEGLPGRNPRILITADAVGGVWQYSNELAAGLSRLGIETILAAMGPSPSQAQIAAASVIPGVTVIDTGLTLDWLASDGNAVRQAGDAIREIGAEHPAT